MTVDISRNPWLKMKSKYSDPESPDNLHNQILSYFRISNNCNKHLQKVIHEGKIEKKTSLKNS